MQFEQRIRNTREDNDITQKEIAEALKITQQQYSLYESGKRTLPIDLFIRICEIYSLSADYLLGFIDEQRPLHQ